MKKLWIILAVVVVLIMGCDKKETVDGVTVNLTESEKADAELKKKMGGEGPWGELPCTNPALGCKAKNKDAAISKSEQEKANKIEANVRGTEKPLPPLPKLNPAFGK